MFSKITMIDYRQPLSERAKSRKMCGPYYWNPTKAPCGGRGFYQAQNTLAMDRHGSTFDLRIEIANAFLDVGSHYWQIDGYYCDEFQDQTMQPIVARLPKSRGYLAGWTMGRGMCATLETDIYETPQDAAYAAHSLAERDAEEEREYQERQREEFEREEREEQTARCIENSRPDMYATA